MKISLKNTPEQVELIKAMGSKNKVTSAEAMEVFADFVAPVARKVLDQAGTTSGIYSSFEYDEDSEPSVPLDSFYNEGIDYVTVWSQSYAGGLARSEVMGLEECKISVFRLDSAVAMLKKYARKARLDVVSKTVTKMLQEVLVKENLNGWAVLTKALAEASTNSLSHVISADTANIFAINDLNRLLTRARRINLSFANGTPSNFDSRGITDLYVSPEITEQIRAFAYQPMNTRGVPNSDESTAVPLADAIREEIYRSAGTQEIYGVAIHELLELGDGEKYNTLFDNSYTSSFTNASDQIVVGIDLSREACLSPIERNGENGGTFVVTPDDQFVARQDKLGFFGSENRGFIVVDSRVLTGLIV